MTNFNQEDDIWFIGDKCSHHGNDKEIYEAIKERDPSKSFETKNPEQTIKIINTLLGR